MQTFVSVLLDPRIGGMATILISTAGCAAVLMLKPNSQVSCVCIVFLCISPVALVYQYTAHYDTAV